MDRWLLEWKYLEKNSSLARILVFDYIFSCFLIPIPLKPNADRCLMRSRYWIIFSFSFWKSSNLTNWFSFAAHHTGDPYVGIDRIIAVIVLYLRAEPCYGKFKSLSKPSLLCIKLQIPSKFCKFQNCYWLQNFLLKYSRYKIFGQNIRILVFLINIILFFLKYFNLFLTTTIVPMNNIILQISLQ